MLHQQCRRAAKISFPQIAQPHEWGQDYPPTPLLSRPVLSSLPPCLPTSFPVSLPCWLCLTLHTYTHTYIHTCIHTTTTPLPSYFFQLLNSLNQRDDSSDNQLQGSKYAKVVWALAAVLAKLEGGSGLGTTQWLVLFGSPDLQLGRRETGGHGLA